MKKDEAVGDIVFISNISEIGIDSELSDFCSNTKHSLEDYLNHKLRYSPIILLYNEEQERVSKFNASEVKSKIEQIGQKGAEEEIISLFGDTLEIDEKSFILDIVQLSYDEAVMKISCAYSGDSNYLLHKPIDMQHSEIPLGCYSDDIKEISLFACTPEMSIEECEEYIGICGDYFTETEIDMWYKDILLFIEKINEIVFRYTKRANMIFDNLQEDINIFNKKHAKKGENFGRFMRESLRYSSYAVDNIDKQSRSGNRIFQSEEEMLIDKFNWRTGKRAGRNSI